MKKKLSIFGMPVEVRDFVPDDTVIIVEKKGQRLTVVNETMGSESVYETPPKLHLIRVRQQSNKGGEETDYDKRARYDVGDEE